MKNGVKDELATLWRDFLDKKTNKNSYSQHMSQTYSGIGGYIPSSYYGLGYPINQIVGVQPMTTTSNSHPGYYINYTIDDSMKEPETLQGLWRKFLVKKGIIKDTINISTTDTSNWLNQMNVAVSSNYSIGQFSQYTLPLVRAHFTNAALTSYGLVPKETLQGLWKAFLEKKAEEKAIKDYMNAPRYKNE
jgi:hypothetical protein